MDEKTQKLAERIASQCNKRVLLVDVRDHIGGNDYDERTPEGLKPVTGSYNRRITADSTSQAANQVSHWSTSTFACTAAASPAAR